MQTLTDVTVSMHRISIGKLASRSTAARLKTEILGLKGTIVKVTNVGMVDRTGVRMHILSLIPCGTTLLPRVSPNLLTNDRSNLNGFIWPGLIWSRTWVIIWCLF